MNEEAKTINNGNEVSSKIRTSELMIIVNGPADEPWYSIRYYDLSDNEWHVDFSSYCLSYVMDWKNQHFELVEPVEHVGYTKPVEKIIKSIEKAEDTIEVENYETERNWEADYQDLNHKFLTLCEELDEVQKELKKSQEETKNITKEYNLLKEELQEQLQESAYFRGKAEAYSNSLKYLGNKGWDSISNN